MNMPSMTKREWSASSIGEMIALLLIGLLALFVTISAWSYPGESRVYPTLIGASLLVLVILRAIALLVQPEKVASASVEDPDDETPREDLPTKYMGIYASIVILFIASLYFIWFPITAFICGILILKIVFNSSWRSALLSSACVTVISSAVFWMLGVPLPGPGF